ncbi:MAG: glycosyltransferase [Bacteroidales bacterium]|jgi:glycosyltransferase involved in cell wall biosynthesis|nr:glycosyltransferase [Bacteroidales bacterium]
MKYKVSIIGYLAKQKPLFDGQTVKTKQLASVLHSHLSSDDIGELDMQGMRRSPVVFFWNFFKICRNSKNVIILPAYGALLLFPLLCLLFRGSETKLFYDVIGGWLPGYVEKHSYLKFLLKKFDGIWVETTVMKKALEEKGFENLTIVPNFKNLTILNKEDLNKKVSAPIRLCIFSRIMEQKGIDDAVNSVMEVNAEEQMFSLDIYGQIDPSYLEHFTLLQKKFPKYIRYCGCVDASKSTEILREYDALLFPTRFPTEGLPGTLIDGYSAGLPVISARWQSFSDFVDEGKTGIGYAQFDYNELVRTLRVVKENPSMLINMKEMCLEKAREYSADTVSHQILSLIGL